MLHTLLLPKRFTFSFLQFFLSLSFSSQKSLPLPCRCAIRLYSQVVSFFLLSIVSVGPGNLPCLLLCSLRISFSICYTDFGCCCFLRLFRYVPGVHIDCREGGICVHNLEDEGRNREKMRPEHKCRKEHKIPMKGKITMKTMAVREFCLIIAQ